MSGKPVELIGRIEVGDGDISDELTLTITGANASMFRITPNGELKLRELVEHLGVANLAVIASDNGHPPRTASVPVIVHFQKGPGSVELLSEASGLSGPLLLGGLGTILLLLAAVIAILVAYICKGYVLLSHCNNDL